MRHYIILLMSFAALCIVAPAQNIGQSLFKSFKLTTADPQAAREQLSAGNYADAQLAYEACLSVARDNRSAGVGVDGDLVGEYALTLALQGKHELALLNADRARALGAAFGDWYSHQVLKLAGCYDQAILLSDVKVPSWVDARLQSSLKTMGSQVPAYEPLVERTDLRRVYALQSSRQTIQALALMHVLIKEYPDVAVLRSSYSNLCEQLGNTSAAIGELQNAIAGMPSSDPGRAVAERHLQELEAKRYDTPRKLSWIENHEARFIWYVGGSIAKKTYSLNTRFGIHTRKHWSASANAGVSLVDKNVTGSVGLSGFYTWRILVFGQGLTYRFGKNTNSFNWSPSVGLTFINSSQTSSFDVTIGAHVPFSGGGKTSIYLSLGKTFYFDINPKKKLQ